jgi:hypothetical protein
MLDEQRLIGHCGINCGICTAYLAYAQNIPKQKGVTYCTGCRVRNKKCAFIKKNCPKKIGKKFIYCYECSRFPCQRLKQLDARYQRDYGESLIKNQEFMKEISLDAFLKAQHDKYDCKKCGGLISVHNGFCYDCGKEDLLAYVNAKKTMVRKIDARKDK